MSMEFAENYFKLFLKQSLGQYADILTKGDPSPGHSLSLQQARSRVGFIGVVASSLTDLRGASAQAKGIMASRLILFVGSEFGTRLDGKCCDWRF